MYLPPVSKTPLTRLHEVMDLKKGYITNQQAKQLVVPKFNELAVKLMWPIATRSSKVRFYLPKEWEGGPEVDRQFFYTVWAHVEE